MGDLCLVERYGYIGGKDVSPVLITLPSSPHQILSLEKRQLDKIKKKLGRISLLALLRSPVVGVVESVAP